jgi:hypothetical protein
MIQSNVMLRLLVSAEALVIKGQERNVEESPRKYGIRRRRWAVVNTGISRE